jgi:hypothetical protein
MTRQYKKWSKIEPLHFCFKAIYLAIFSKIYDNSSKDPAKSSKDLAK